MGNDLRKEAAAFGNAIFNIDDEYVLHICSTCYKPFEIYKPKLWTDATHYVCAWSDDGIHWEFMDTCGQNVGSIESSSISGIANQLWTLNRNRHYVLRPSQGCCGQSDSATDFKKVPSDTIMGVLNIKKNIGHTKVALDSQIQSAFIRASESTSSPKGISKEPEPEI